MNRNKRRRKLRFVREYNQRLKMGRTSLSEVGLKDMCKKKKKDKKNRQSR